MSVIETFNRDGWPWWTSAFNGQSRRIKNFFVLGNYIKPDFAIETGTYVGSSTELLNGLGVRKIFSIEIVEEYANIAKKRLWRLIEQGRLEIVVGSSTNILPQILREISKECSVMLYLDAHWNDYLPLTDEIKALIEWGGPFLAIIDDFCVPTFPGYGFDVYGESVVGPAAIPENSSLSLWIPDESDEWETGARRGTGYLFSKDALEKCPKNFFSDLKLQEHKF